MLVTVNVNQHVDFSADMIVDVGGRTRARRCKPVSKTHGGLKLEVKMDVRMQVDVQVDVDVHIEMAMNVDAPYT